MWGEGRLLLILIYDKRKLDKAEKLKLTLVKSKLTTATSDRDNGVNDSKEVSEAMKRKYYKKA